METENEYTSMVFETAKTTSWSIIHGSLDDTVTYESSLSAVDSDSVAVIRRQPPLVLHRPTSESSPCEITIRFEQQHEVRQVYVRSTARIYEIYCASEAKSDYEYLCTVRCGLAAENVEAPVLTKEEKISKPTDVEQSLHASFGMPKGPVDAEKSRISSGSSTSEDGWVEVKVPDSLPIDKGTSLSKRTEICQERGTQDFYEATAEISDADPCISLTLRLLSIQSGEYVYIDEVYIFADPVVSDDSIPPATQSSAGNTLMSVLVPTLLQLSKTQISQMQDKHDVNKTERRICEDVEPRLSGSAMSSTEVQHERASDAADPEKLVLEKVNSSSFQPSVSGSQTQALDGGDKHKPDPTGGINKFSASHIERTLDNLVSRLSKIEDFCLRFEENMVKPITSMEARLERVEQQLELLTQNSCCSRTALCTRISAPEFSCSGSEFNSFYGDENKYSSCGAAGAAESLQNGSESNSFCNIENNYSSRGATGAAESFKKDDCPFNESSLPPSDLPSSPNGSQLLPSLVVAAPEFSYLEDDEENDAVEATKESTKQEPKKRLSINDALASALAGFLSSPSPQPATSTHTTVGAHIYNQESSSDDPVASAIVNVPIVPSTLQDRTNEAASMESFALTPHDSSANGDKQKFPVADCNSEEVIESVDVEATFLGEGSILTCCDHSVDSQSEQDAERSTNDCHLSADRVEMSEADTERREICTSESDLSENIFLVREKSNDISDAVSEAVDNRPDSTKEGGKSDVLLNILKLSSPPLVDFRIPLLDIEFRSQGTSISSSPLEALLTDIQEPLSSDLQESLLNSMQGPLVEILPCVQERERCANAKQNDLVEVEDEESPGLLAVNHRLVDLDYFSSGSRDVPLCVSGERLQDSLICSSQDTIAALLSETC